MLPTAVARSFSDRVTKSREKEALLRVFFPTDNVLYMAFETHTKTAEPIDMPFGMTSGLDLPGLSEQCVTWGLRSPKGRGSLRENVLDKHNTPINCKLDWYMQQRAYDMGRR